MVSGVIVAVLKEQFADHITLSDGTSMSLPTGLVIKELYPGSPVTIVYSRESAGNEKVIQSVTHYDLERSLNENDNSL
jgi:hypothetical protein